MLRRDPFADPEALIRRLYRYVSWRLGDGPDAEDVTSEALERALRYRDSYDPRKGEPLTWLVGIARRCIDDAFDNRVVVMAETPERAAPGAVEEETIARLTLREAVAKLPVRDQELLSLRYGADLSVTQIARMLDLRRNTAQVALHRALERLREALDEAAAAPELPARASGL